MRPSLSSLLSFFSSLGFTRDGKYTLPPGITTASATPCRLPLELIDCIIDFAHSDRATLCACTLVHKDWLSAARYHLFSNICLHAKNFQLLFVLFKSSSFDATLIRELELRVNAKRASSLCSSFPEAMLPKLHLLLPSVRSLSIYAMDLSLPLSISFAALRHLDLDQVSAKSFELVATLLCTLPSLHSLRLDATWDAPWVLPSSLPAVPAFPELSSLELGCNTGPFLEWLLTFAEVPKVASLTLRSVECDEIPAVSRYLAAVGPTLTSLKFVLPIDWDDAVHLDLSHATALRTLSLAAHTHHMRTVVACTLACLPSEALTTLALTFVGAFSAKFTLPNAHPLDAALAGPRFHNVQRLELAAWPVSRKLRAGDSTALRGLFPLAHARGIVAVHRLSRPELHALCPLPSFAEKI